LAAALLAAALPAAAAEADDAQQVRSAELTAHYDTALQLYTKGDYSRAIMEWREVLRKAPDQSTAEKMIQMAREAIDARDRERQESVYAKAAAGDYQGALVALQPLLEADTLHPAYNVLQTRLDRVSFIVPKASTDTKAWRAAVRGLAGYVAREDDLPLAYDGLRWAKELDPKEPLFNRLIAVLLADNPALAQDAVSPGMGVLEYKRFLALNLIYDGKYPQAAGVLEKVVALDPEDVTALKRLGSAYFALNEKAKARALWKRAMALKPDDRQLQEFLSRVDLPE
jgi:tetratricopeptide (TPR) repeat protein